MLHAIYRHNRVSNTDKDLFHILHRMRGLIHVSQALLQSKHDHRNSNVFNSTPAIFFFGTPHQGFDDESLLQIVRACRMVIHQPGSHSSTNWMKVQTYCTRKEMTSHIFWVLHRTLKLSASTRQRGRQGFRR
jgi:hypothetical protein